ncbi:hypothetical protein CEUSTIGMA_g9304.t1 [Chlamydomonas eustigma]|uniref:BCNT-C domain-containing protein n=1 Tax=Chlamydomonas eustigma TaxID=1157962 RepID=A0A250XFR6_9CHLO|nr:hypothetical protein CEUSTIGMA_g9304.t1 [Chlamydomonas eustigma]|eukprot:GAX81876.1 hypothetical protein CEUSTIGMA_g9304.t1 [Chlamydomonas eustigma]
MASFLNANLPSEDEEDDDYDPTADKSCEKEDRQDESKTKKGIKRGRGIVSHASEPVAAEEVADDKPHSSKLIAVQEDEFQEEAPTAKSLAKRAKIDAVWQALNSREIGGSNATGATGAPSSRTSLAALCGRTKTTLTESSELTWQRQLGLMAPQVQRKVVAVIPGKQDQQETLPPTSSYRANVDDNVPPAAHSGTAAAHVAGDVELMSKQASAPEPSSETTARTSEAASHGPREEDSSPATTLAVKTNGSSISEAAKEAALSAINAAKEAASLGVARSYNKMAVTETRRFAGKDIQVTTQIDKNSKEAAKLAQKDAQKSVAAASGLDRFLAELDKKKKVNILDKSKMDWNQMKSTDTHMEEELEAHKRSSNKYLDKVDFLKKAELREYELERDKRLAGDIRLRNRL